MKSLTVVGIFAVFAALLAPLFSEPMNLNQFLLWLASGGGAAIVLAFVLERIPAFCVLSSDMKSWINLGGTVVLAMLAYVVLTYVPANILDAVAPFFTVVAAVFVSWLAGQAAHSVDPAKK
jgi:hypothetical protein